MHCLLDDEELELPETRRKLGLLRELGGSSVYRRIFDPLSFARVGQSALAVGLGATMLVSQLTPANGFFLGLSLTFMALEELDSWYGERPRESGGARSRIVADSLFPQPSKTTTSPTTLSSGFRTCSGWAHRIRVPQRLPLSLQLVTARHIQIPSPRSDHARDPRSHPLLVAHSQGSTWLDRNDSRLSHLPTASTSPASVTSYLSALPAYHHSALHSAHRPLRASFHLTSRLLRRDGGARICGVESSSAVGESQTRREGAERWHGQPGGVVRVREPGDEVGNACAETAVPDEGEGGRGW